MKHIQMSKRSEGFVKILAECGTKITGTATLKKKSHKHGYQNALLTDISFEFMGNEIQIDHCWLQQCDYPRAMFKAISMAMNNSWVKIDFVFYPYHDAIDRGMYGMKVTKIIILPPKKQKKNK